MLRLAIAACLLISATAFAADAPKPDPTYTVQLTANEIQVLTIALETTAHQCGMDADGACQIGLIGPSIRAKFIAAEKQAGK